MDGCSSQVAGRTSAVPSPSKGTTPRPDAAASLIQFRFYLESAKFELNNVRLQHRLPFETGFTNALKILGFKWSLWVADWRTLGQNQWLFRVPPRRHWRNARLRNGPSVKLRPSCSPVCPITSSVCLSLIVVSALGAGVRFIDFVVCSSNNSSRASASAVNSRKTISTRASLTCRRRRPRAAQPNQLLVSCHLAGPHLLPPQYFLS